ncbi:diguanylate cyclase domain-containing protein [Inhella sp.]|uniref:diguanylate cyclase domain-containing protein n=1 Tax=Inhella sp. TaxID=1921806 RepID=UPI0035ADEC8F
MRRTLEQTLHRGLRSAALWTALCVGGLGALGSLAVLQAQAKRHLDLLARTVAYSVEAAVTFRDAEAAREAMQAVLNREELAAIRIELGDGRVFAAVERAGGWSSSLEAGLAQWLPLQAQAPVLPEDPGRGRVHVQTSAAPLLWLLAAYLGVALATVAGTAGLVLALARRVERQITTPLDTMRRLTRSIRADRAFDRRAPGADIEEFHALAEDFNALLGMVQAHEAALLRQQELLAQHNQLLRREAFSDTLTGLANRARFRQEVAGALERAAGEHELAVLFIDADGLKRVNDLHGHAIGDRLLQEVAARLRGALRDSDCVARLGGDEYAVLLEPLLQREHLPLLVAKIQAAMQAPLPVDAQLSLQPSVSVGWAIYPSDGADVDALLARADEAMYANKRARRASPRELTDEATA